MILACLEMANKWVQTVKKHGGDAQVVHLPKAGIKGNTHFPFSALNNMEVADHFENADELGVSTKDYSLWGSSAGARMAAVIGSYGIAAYGEKNLPRPATVVMAYTGHSDFTPADPPTFVTVSADDPIANAIVVERRVQAMRRAGIDVEFVKFQRAGHGFGLGIGTDAEDWIELAIQFWEKHIR